MTTADKKKTDEQPAGEVTRQDILQAVEDTQSPTVVTAPEITIESKSPKGGWQFSINLVWALAVVLVVRMYIATLPGELEPIPAVEMRAGEVTVVPPDRAHLIFPDLPGGKREETTDAE